MLGAPGMARTRTYMQMRRRPLWREKRRCQSGGDTSWARAGEQVSGYTPPHCLSPMSLPLSLSLIFLQFLKAWSAAIVRVARCKGKLANSLFAPRRAQAFYCRTPTTTPATSTPAWHRLVTCSVPEFVYILYIYSCYTYRTGIRCQVCCLKPGVWN